jgi:dTDP-4-amino-4,6-dideoxygalactose transaminase
MIQPLNLKKQYKLYKKQFLREIKKVYEGGTFILGDNVKTFEKEFADYCGTKFAVGVNSGTDALFLALKAIGIGPGDEVIVPVFTYIATALAVSYTGAKPVFVDIYPETFNIDAGKIERAITNKTRAILPVHLYGQPADMLQISDIAKRHSLKVVEDAAQAHGAVYETVGGSKKTGSLGHIGCFSFYPTKNLGAFGDAGIITTSDEDIYKKLLLLRDYGRTSRYEHRIKGYNSRLDEVQATLLRIKLHFLDGWNDRRNLIAGQYRKRLAKLPLTLPAIKKGVKHVYHQFVIKTGGRDSLQNFLSNKGVISLIHYPIPIHLQKCYSELNYKEGDFPVAEKCAEKVISLPIYPELSRKDIDSICNFVTEFYEKHSNTPNL